MNSISPEKLFSKHVDDEFVIYFSLPQGYDQNQIYPALYLLDAQWAFPKAVRAATNLQKSKKFPPFILIGIGYPKLYRENGYIRHRVRDLTFPADVAGDPEYELSGRADQFTAFLHQELIPTIEARYSIDTKNRTLLGHSLGGYYALYNLLRFPDTPFQNFIAASASLWWGDGFLFGLEEKWKLEGRSVPPRPLITAGEKEGAEQVTESERMVHHLQKWRHIGLETRYRLYKGARHRASAIASLVDGARWFYTNKGE
ncbi:MAG: alpha/beta hydrolase-fold protein [Saprospiraceae bacterium]